jgi:hypothetical protein
MTTLPISWVNDIAEVTIFRLTVVLTIEEPIDNDRLKMIRRN